MTAQNELNAQAARDAAQAEISPHSVKGGQPGQDRPHFVDTSETGISWSGMIRGSDIIELDGETYGDTNIRLDNADTLERINRAREVIPQDTDSLYSDPNQMAAFFDTFAARIHQDDVVGDYFPEVKDLQRKQDVLLEAARDRVLEGGALEEIRALEESRQAQNTIDWRNRSQNGAVTDAAVRDIEERNEYFDILVLDVQRQAALETLGAERAAEIEAEARAGVGNLSDYDMQHRIVARLMDAASRARLPEVEAEQRAQAAARGEDFSTYDELVAQEKAAWNRKHAGQDDFADAMRDRNPDCSEYASLSAVSLAQSGIQNLRVMGHVMHDDRFAMVGAHAYNVILDEAGENVIGVFEGTATTGAFRQVMNNVSLAEFEAGQNISDIQRGSRVVNIWNRASRQRE